MRTLGRTIKLYIDATPLVAEHFSGVGHSLLGLVTALDVIAASENNLRATLVVPKDLRYMLNKWHFPNLKTASIPINSHKIAELQQKDRLPWLDLMIGKGSYFFPNFLGWPLLLSKSIVQVHDLSYELYPQFVDPPNQKFLSNMVPKSIRRAAKVATVSPNSKVEIEKFYNLKDEDVVVIPNAVESKVFYPRSNKETDEAKKKYGLVGDYFIFVGNLEPRKNIEVLIEAYRQLPKPTTDSVGLLFIGSKGWNDSDISQAMSKAKKDGFNVMVPSKYVLDSDLPALYSGAKALVYPPIYEGFGMPPLEAMACGIPVVCSEVSSLPWVVGEAAVLIDPNKPESITIGMERVLKEPLRSNLIHKGKKQVKGFKWEDSASTLIMAMRNL